MSRKRYKAFCPLQLCETPVPTMYSAIEKIPEQLVMFNIHNNSIGLRFAKGIGHTLMSVRAFEEIK